MQLDVTEPQDSILVSEIPLYLRTLQGQIGVFADIVDVPASAVSAGVPGNYALTNDFAYFYTGDGTTHAWRRVVITSW